jgi:hypothetical protein
VTATDSAQLIGSVALLINAVFTGLSYVQSWRNGRMLTEVKTQTDGITDELIKSAGKVGAAEGTAAGLVEGHAAGLDQGRKEMRAEKN